MSRPALRDLSIDDIDNPHAPARGPAGFGDLDELAGSIRQLGIIEPLVVVKRRGRYEVVAGHRRLLAARIAGLAIVPCVVHESFKTAEEAVMIHENVHRQDLNPADEARFYARLLERVDGDTAKLAELVKQQRVYVEGRLLLLQGDPDVFAAVERDEIGIGVAAELNLYHHQPTRFAHLQLAAAGGAKITTVRAWRQQANTFHELQQTRDPATIDAPAAVVTPALPDPFRCMFCGSSEDVWTMEQLYIHKPCRSLLRQAIGDRLKDL